ncbi:MAG TPA: hypothetical protein VLN46_03490 [Gillisia sp.]|nr:hypothetical protein [Gillisia sp.]
MRTDANQSLNVLLLIFIFIISAVSQAQETTVMIRVQSKDAKFIGSSIGGAKIIVKDDLTGSILAEGITKGSTGNTEIIMVKPRLRGDVITDENTAGFLAKLEITEPVFVTIEATAPVNKKQASVKATTQLWVLPGKHIGGDGIILEVPGFVVDILSPQTHETIPGGKEISIAANVVLMCGCPVTSGGMWNADTYEVNALITKVGEEPKTIPLKIQDKPSTFAGIINLNSGIYEIIVYAFDPLTGNTGLDKTNIIIP